MELDKLYSNRFDHDEQKRKTEIWRVLCEDFFSKYIKDGDVILDPAAGYCEFINLISNSPRCRKIASDLNPDMLSHANKNVETHISSAENLEFLPDASVDVVYVSNFFEHIKDRELITKMLREFNRVLKKGGTLLVMQPNIRFAYKEYWDFFDHYTPISDRSMVEAVNMAGGYEIMEIIPQFMPYTTKSRIPQSPLLVKMYLKFPPAWKIMGKQLFLVARKV